MRNSTNYAKRPDRFPKPVRSYSCGHNPKEGFAKAHASSYVWALNKKVLAITRTQYMSMEWLELLINGLKRQNPETASPILPKNKTFTPVPWTIA